MSLKYQVLMLNTKKAVCSKAIATQRAVFLSPLQVVEDLRLREANILWTSAQRLCIFQCWRLSIEVQVMAIITPCIWQQGEWLNNCLICKLTTRKWWMLLRRVLCRALKRVRMKDQCKVRYKAHNKEHSRERALVALRAQCKVHLRGQQWELLQG